MEAVDNDDMFFDAKEYHAANKHVANILSSDKTATSGQTGEAADAGKTEEKKVVEQATLDNLDGGDWGDGEDPIDIDMGDDLMADADVAAGGDDAGGAGQIDSSVDNDIFVPPSQGADPLQ